MPLQLQFASDFHFEFHFDKGFYFIQKMLPKADTLVLAGDIVPLQGYAHVLKLYKFLCSKFKTVVMVPGNHEYYGTNPVDGLKMLARLTSDIPNFKVLSSDTSVFIDGHRLVGDTMWFADDYLNVQYKDRMNDFGVIGNFVPWVYQQNQKWMKFLDKELKEGDIVVTHHLPSYRLVAPELRKSNLNRFFVCETEKWILDKKPALWLFGHTHTSCDQMIGATRCVANPLGYPGEYSVQTFNEGLVLEVL